MSGNAVGGDLQPKILMFQPTYISGKQAWDKLISLNYSGKNSYRNFFQDWDIFYRPHWEEYTDKDGKMPEPEKVKFSWIIKRDYNGHNIDKVEAPPYYELCISLPTDPKERFMAGNYSPPRFIWNNERGLREIFLAPKINFEI